ncbi:hypothetical protein [Hydrogenimonas sp.]
MKRPFFCESNAIAALEETKRGLTTIEWSKPHSKPSRNSGQESAPSLMPQ